MEYLNDKYRNGGIYFKTYEKILETIAHLDQNGWKFIDNIGIKSYGSVLEVKNSRTGAELTTKVVEKEEWK